MAAWSSALDFGAQAVVGYDYRDLTVGVNQAIVFTGVKVRVQDKD